MCSVVDVALRWINRSIHPKQYGQKQAITTLAMVADASEATFAKAHFVLCCVVFFLLVVADVGQCCSSIMPLLLNVLRNANGSDYRKLMAKGMEYARLIAIVVRRDIFRPGATTSS